MEENIKDNYEVFCFCLLKKGELPYIMPEFGCSDVPWAIARQKTALGLPDTFKIRKVSFSKFLRACIRDDMSVRYIDDGRELPI